MTCLAAALDYAPLLPASNSSAASLLKQRRNGTGLSLPSSAQLLSGVEDFFRSSSPTRSAARSPSPSPGDRLYGTF